MEVRRRQVLLGGYSLTVDVGEAAEGPASLYLRPNDVVLTHGDCSGLKGTVRQVRRTAAGRRAEIEIDLTGTVVEVEVPGLQPLKGGDRAGIHIVKARLFAGA